MMILISPLPDLFWRRMRSLILPHQARLVEFRQWLEQIPARDLFEYSALEEAKILSVDDLIDQATVHGAISLGQTTLYDSAFEHILSLQECDNSATPIRIYLAECEAVSEGGDPNSFYRARHLRNAEIRILDMKDQSVILLQDCKIDTLFLGKDVHLKCKNVFIGRLFAGADLSVRHLDISEGALFSIAGPGWVQPHSINGDIWISPRTYLPSRDDEYKSEVHGFQVGKTSVAVCLLQAIAKPPTPSASRHFA